MLRATRVPRRGLTPSDVAALTLPQLVSEPARTSASPIRSGSARAEEIREHFAAGRLDEDELNERLSAAYAAKTNGELAALRADLPGLPATRRSEAEAGAAPR